MELVLVALRKITRTFQVLGRAVDFVFNPRKGIVQPLLDQGDRKVRDINPDPAPIEFLCGVYGSAAPAKRIENNRFRLAGPRNYPFEQGKWFLGRIAETLGVSTLE